MRGMRKWAAGLIALSFLAAACGKTENVQPNASPSASISEVTVEKCTTNQGTVAPAAATGATFTTKKAGELLVGSDTTYPPFESIEGGKTVGFDVDLVEALAKKLPGTPKVRFQTADFKTIFTALASHKFDVVASAVTIKEERKRTIDFTDPYFSADLSLAVDTSKQATIKTIDDLAGKTVGGQDGTTGLDCANALKEAGKVGEVRAYKDILAAFSDLTAGRIAAIVNDLPTSKKVVEKRGGSLAIVQLIRTREAYGLAVPKDNPNLREALNTALKEIKADGTYKALFVKWFETEPPQE